MSHDDDDDEIEGKPTRDIAVKALSHILMHEKICAERWGDVKKLGYGVLALLGTQIIVKLAEFVHFGPVVH